jgi:murein L,D-transpeptidase YafK
MELAGLIALAVALAAGHGKGDEGAEAAARKRADERAGPLDRCIESVDALPQASYLASDDRRLQREHLVVVVKSTRRLMVFDAGRKVACYRIALGFAPEGHKQEEGDGRTPEGWYRTSDKPWSTFDDAIAIHYPNADDAAAGLASGRIARRTRDRIVEATAAKSVPPQATALGGAVLIHGGGSATDWTLGCVALDDRDLASLRGLLGKSMKTDLLILP